MTWLLVNTRPEGLITMPVAWAVPPTYWSLLVMSTTPGSTASATLCSWALLTPVPEFAPEPLPWPKPLPGLMPLPVFGLRPVLALGDCPDGRYRAATDAAPIPAASTATRMKTIRPLARPRLDDGPCWM